MRAPFVTALTFAALLLAGQTEAQQPTQAQSSAIRSACRSDYMTYCSSVPTGGMASLQCLQQNAGSVSAGCQQALSAVSGGGSSGAPPQQSGMGQSMGSPMGQSMGQPAAAPSPRPMPPPPPPPRQMSPRQEMAILRGSCGFDFRRFCRGVQLGGGRGLACLKAYGPSLTPQCQSALLAMRGSR
jgi:hypothetical protein